MEKFSKQIVLDVSRFRDAHGYEKPEEMIQWAALERFFTFLQESLEKAANFSPGCSRRDPVYLPDRYHDTITVAGGRGTGKTTFILSLFRLIRSGKFNGAFGSRFDNLALRDIEILPIVDPTLVEEKEHVFINILSRIKKMVDDRFGGEFEQCSLVEPELASCSSRKCTAGKIEGREAEHRDWIESLRKLAGGLPALEGIGTDEIRTEKWNDPIHVMEQGLRNTEASNELEVNFHIFVAKSLQILGKKAFLLAFDDIDTQFKVGAPVLEIIRKYLTTPQIITIISGDLSLYTMLVRDKQWDNFGDKLLRQEGDRAREIHRMVDQLVDQYLLKILKPERRLALKSLQEYLDADYELYVQHKGPKELLDHMVKVICRDVIFAGDETELFQRHILTEPVRRVVQILHGYFERFKDINDSNFLVARENFIKLLVDIFRVPLQQNGFEPDEVTSPTPRTFLNYLVMTLVQKNLLAQGYRLKPEHLDRSVNSTMIVVGATAANLMLRNRHLYFEYFVKVGLTRELSLVLPEKAETGPSLKEYLQASGLAAGEDSLRISRFSAGYSRMAAAPGTEASVAKMLSTTVWQGTVALLGLQKTTRPGSKEQMANVQSHYGVPTLDKITESPRALPLEFYSLIKDLEDRPGEMSANRIDKLFSRITSWHRHFINLPVSVALTKEGSRLPFGSIFNLLSVVSRIIEAATTEVGESMLDADVERKVWRAIVRDAQLRDYRLTGTTIGVLSSTDADDSEDSDGEFDEEEFGGRDFIRATTTWAKQAEPGFAGLPMYLIGKMTTRFYYTLTTMNFAADQLYLGQLLNRFLVAFLNAVLVEEQLYLGRPRVRLVNPTRTDAVLFQNIRYVFGDNAFSPGTRYSQDTSPFFCWIASCPLWLMYANPQSSGRREESLFGLLMNLQAEPFQNGDVFYKKKKIDVPNVFTLLNSVLLQRDAAKRDETSPARTAFIDRKMTPDDKVWLNDKIEKELARNKSRASNAILAGDPKEFVKAILFPFFHRSIGIPKTPSPGTSALRDQVEAFLLDRAKAEIKTKA